MRYNALFTFPDAEQDHFIDFRFPMHGVSNPEGEAIQIGGASSTATENETSNEIEEEEEEFIIYTLTWTQKTGNISKIE